MASEKAKKALGTWMKAAIYKGKWTYQEAEAWYFEQQSSLNVTTRKFVSSILPEIFEQQLALHQEGAKNEIISDFVKIALRDDKSYEEVEKTFFEQRPHLSESAHEATKPNLKEIYTKEKNNQIIRKFMKFCIRDDKSYEEAEKDFFEKQPHLSEAGRESMKPNLKKIYDEEDSYRVKDTAIATLSSAIEMAILQGNDTLEKVSEWLYEKFPFLVESHLIDELLPEIFQKEYAKHMNTLEEENKRSQQILADGWDELRQTVAACLRQGQSKEELIETLGSSSITERSLKIINEEVEKLHNLPRDYEAWAKEAVNNSCMNSKEAAIWLLAHREDVILDDDFNVKFPEEFNKQYAAIKPIHDALNGLMISGCRTLDDCMNMLVESKRGNQLIKETFEIQLKMYGAFKDKIKHLKPVFDSRWELALTTHAVDFLEEQMPEYTGSMPKELLARFTLYYVRQEVKSGIC